MSRKFRPVYLLAIPLLCLAVVVVFNIPFVHDRLAWRIENARVRLQYAINPPEEAIFIPQEQVDVAAMVNATLTALAPTLYPTPTETPNPLPTNPGPTDTPFPSPTPTFTATPLPLSVRLAGVRYEDQHNRFNYCGPANLSMALTYWGWSGDRDVVAAYVKSNDADKNVMPYELQDFVLTQTAGFGALIRYGGGISLLQRLIANGFPVLAEKGYYTYDLTGRYGWLGHYQFITGYDVERGVLVVQDTYIQDGENHEFSYGEFISGWRSFNYLFMVVYPVEREAEVLALLGEWADVNWAARHALEIARNEVATLTGNDQYFAAFNMGTSHVALYEYADAANAYDYAFQLNAALPDDDLRPYRMMWYQTGPYRAYYYTGRFQDVINLANVTFDTIGDDVLEESFYWRGMARLALGDTEGAIEDFRRAVELHPDFQPALEQLELLGVQP